MQAISNKVKGYIVVALIILSVGIELYLSFYFFQKGDKQASLIVMFVSSIPIALLFKYKLKLSGAYYRFETGKNNLFRNPNACYKEIPAKLTNSIVYHDLLNTTSNFVANIVMVVFGIIGTIAVAIYLLDDAYYFIATIALIYFGIRNINRNSKHPRNRVVLMLGEEGLWTEQLGYVSWQSVKEANLILFYGGIKGNQERSKFEIILYNRSKDWTSLWELGINKYKFRLLVKQLNRDGCINR